VADIPFGIVGHDCISASIFSDYFRPEYRMDEDIGNKERSAIKRIHASCLWHSQRNWGNMRLMPGV
jgi:hypothetical protein